MGIDFPGFLDMTGNGDLLRLLREIDSINPIPKSEAMRLSHLVRIHMATGLTPSAVNCWIRYHDFSMVDKEIALYKEIGQAPTAG